MQEIVERFFENLTGRVDGPFAFRFILQPIVATLFAVRDGRRDAREGRPPYFWALFTDPEHRRELLREGWKSTAKVFCIAVVIDVVYGLVVFRWVYPVETIVVAVALAFLPYLLIRGPLNRLLSREGVHPNQDIES